MIFVYKYLNHISYFNFYMIYVDQELHVRISDSHVSVSYEPKVNCHNKNDVRTSEINLLASYIAKCPHGLVLQIQVFILSGGFLIVRNSYTS